jgi:hypothetical protein
MENKYSRKTQTLIEKFLNYIESWNNIFSVSINYYIEGWAAYLTEKSMFPRSIVVFNPYDFDYFSLKSFEVSYDKNGKECFTEIYSKENIHGFENLLRELKDVIFGKDLINSIKNYK